MVSPFMSFATGALQAVDKNIDRYRAQKAAEEEREDARAQRMKELEFQRETKLEAQRISADATKEAQRMASSSQAGSALGGLLGTLGAAYIQFG